MRLPALTIAALALSFAPAAAHGLHASPVSGHDHGALVAALLALPVLAAAAVALFKHLRR